MLFAQRLRDAFHCQCFLENRHVAAKQQGLSSASAVEAVGATDSKGFHCVTSFKSLRFGFLNHFLNQYKVIHLMVQLILVLHQHKFVHYVQENH